MTHEELSPYLQKSAARTSILPVSTHSSQARAKILEAKSRSIQMEVSGVLSALTVTQAG